MSRRYLPRLVVFVLTFVSFVSLAYITLFSPTWLSNPSRILPFVQVAYAQEEGMRLFLPSTRTQGTSHEIPADDLGIMTLLGLINEERTSVGCLPLQYNAKLATIASTHSTYMAEMNEWKFEGADGKFADSRLQQSGYLYGYWGENLAYSYADDAPELQATGIMTRWVEDESEFGFSVWLENIRTCEFSQIGIASSERNDGYLAYWDLLLAGQKPELPQFVTVDIHDRADVGSVYQDIYLPTLNVPLGWTGDHASCDAGLVSPDYLDAVQLQINYFRAMAGVPAVIVFKPEYNQKAQEAALIMSVAGQANHNPPESWQCYSEAGYLGASHSNLYVMLDNFIPYVIQGYIEDPGSTNSPVGHRRWLLASDGEVMGIGTVGVNPNGEYAGNATYIASSEREQWPNNESYRGRAFPSTRDSFVAWPPPGYVPQGLTFPRWSFSIPNPKITYEPDENDGYVEISNVNFESATVDVWVDEEPIQVTIENRAGINYGGMPTLVWNAAIEWLELDYTQEHSVQVMIRNVTIDGKLQDFEYEVILFDPEL